MSKRLVILDRDGVINYDSPNFIKKPMEWRPIPGSIEAIAKLKSKGLMVAIATNQSGVGRGIVKLPDLFGIHAKLLNQVRQFGSDVDGIFFCPHRPEQNCECRKPKPGMLREITKRFAISGNNCIVIGDSPRDLQAAETIGAKTVLVLTGNGKKTLVEHESGLNIIPKNVEVFDDLRSAVRSIR